MIKKVVMPAAGQTTDVATVTRLAVSVGDSVKRGDVLLEVETDKAVLPIESFARGFVTEIYVKEFDKVDAGSPLLAIGDAADLEAAAAAESHAAPAESALTAAPEEPEDDFVPVIKPVVKPAAAAASPTGKRPDGVRAMPNAKRLAGELGIGLDTVTPSNGVFIKAADVRAAVPAVAAAVPANPAVPAESAPAGNTLPSARMRKTLARRLEESAKAPVFTVAVSVCASSAAAITAREPAVGAAHFVMLALAKLARRYPLLRVRYENGIQKISDTADIGLAVFAENGTVAATVRDASHLGLSEIAAACRDNTAAIARGDLSGADGASCTVYDLSAFRLDGFTAPVGCPGTSAFGITGGDGKFTVTGSFDMRVFEGNVCASVMSDLRDCLENPALLLL